MVLQDGFCNKCGEEYVDKYRKWCKAWEIDNLRGNWTSGNEKIDTFIQEMQLKINYWEDIVFEWIPYNQFSDINEIARGGFATAIWKDGPLKYDGDDTEKYIKSSPNEKIALKCLHNSQNITNNDSAG